MEERMKYLRTVLGEPEVTLTTEVPKPSDEHQALALVRRLEVAVQLATRPAQDAGACLSWRPARGLPKATPAKVRRVPKSILVMVNVWRNG
jgi:hypothetical protein